MMNSDPQQLIDAVTMVRMSSASSGAPEKSSCVSRNMLSFRSSGHVPIVPLLLQF
jgi:hypothetical protein